jgi:hypothetical protein
LCQSSPVGLKHNGEDHLCTTDWTGAYLGEKVVNEKEYLSAIALTWMD